MGSGTGGNGVDLCLEGRAPASPVETACEVLERFGQALQQCDQAGRQIRLVLHTVQDALGADAVFWHPGSTGDPTAVVGPLVPGVDWCSAFVQRVLQGPALVEGRLLVSFLDPASKPLTPWPVSAALLRVSRTRGNWIGALSFHPRRLFQRADLDVMLLARRMLLAHRQQTQVYQKLKDSLLGLVRCLTAAIDAKDPYTWGHSERVARIAVRLGQQLSLAPAVLSDLYLAGLLHDIGKIGIRDSVLQKPGKLNDEELAHIQQHPVIGDRLVSNIPSLQHLRPGVRNHHERWDGRGYPDGLVGEQIPLQARILAVADSCDAMMSARPYRLALPPSRIDSIMGEGAGSQWDPGIVASFLDCRADLYSICQRGLGESVLAAVERALTVGGALEPSSRRDSVLPH
jgi:HD-GYP domain-containing protein (c-di-GMP phosphodiesterase class II)